MSLWSWHMSVRFYIANGKSATIKTKSECNVNLRQVFWSTLFAYAWFICKHVTHIKRLDITGEGMLLDDMFGLTINTTDAPVRSKPTFHIYASITKWAITLLIIYKGNRCVHNSFFFNSIHLTDFIIQFNSVSIVQKL